MKANWINGNITPTSKGEYYVILEATQDIGDYKKGDMELTSDYFSDNEWESIGKDNPSWKVVCWARMLLPGIPNDYLGKVKVYFGQRVGVDE